MRAYNIIGDIHGNRQWERLFIDDGETVNVFTGDYFSPYSVTIDFEDCKQNFLKIIEKKKKNPDKVILLIGNHDFDHWKFNDMMTRHDYKHEEEIKSLFETFDDCFQLAYNVDDKAVVTHAGVSVLWYVRWFLDERFKNPDYKYDPNTVSYWLELLCYDEQIYGSISMKEFIDKQFSLRKKQKKNFIYIIDNGKEILLYDYKNDISTPLNIDAKTFCDNLNNTWREQYYRYSFDNCAHSYDDASSPNMGPTWFRENNLQYYNLFKYQNIYSITGHCRHHHIEKIDDRIWATDVLCYSAESLLIDTDKEGDEMFSVHQKGKSIYLSGPISGHIEEMIPIFKEVKEELIKECGADYVWSPMENISTDASWNDAMNVCESVLATKDFDEIRVIIIKEWTSASKGVKREIEIAKEKHILTYGVEVYMYDDKNVILL